MSPPVRVLVVDDSAFARKVLRQILDASPGVEVVDVARDGLDALEKIERFKPDVITLDLMMPNLDGIGLLRALPPEGSPRVIVVSKADAESDLCITALQNGAVEIVEKPTSLATDRLYELSGELVRKVLAAAAARAPLEVHRPAPPGALAATAAAPRGRSRVLVIGASTGGPQALTRLLTALPGDFPIPIVVALHIPAGYTDALARRLDEASALSVIEASEDLELRPGLAIIARGGAHLALRTRQQRARVSFASVPVPPPYCPSVDVLFGSAAAEFGASTMAVVLTGMGDDGLEGARAIHAAGGTVLAESESSCVVYGMPRRVVEAGIVSEQAPIDALPAAILRHL